VEELYRLRSQFHAYRNQLDEPPDNVHELRPRRPYPCLAEPPVPDVRRFHAHTDSGFGGVAGQPPKPGGCRSVLRRGRHLRWIDLQPTVVVWGLFRQAHLPDAVRKPTARAHHRLGSSPGGVRRINLTRVHQSAPGSRRLCGNSLRLRPADPEVIGDGAEEQLSEEEKISTGSIIMKPCPRRGPGVDIKTIKRCQTNE